MQVEKTMGLKLATLELNYSSFSGSQCYFSLEIHFLPREYMRAFLGVVILSVHPSVCLSHACIVTKLNDALQIVLYHTKGQPLAVTLIPRVVGR